MHTSNKKILDGEKILVFVPHPDDEINIAGQLIYYCSKKSCTIKVVYMTNGDYISDYGSVRMQEALEALMILGVPDTNVIFLGYGDGWQGNKHIYNMCPEQVGKSNAGFQMTYGLKNHPEYCMNKSGDHQEYTRENLKNDIKDILETEMPDIIIGTDFDSHPDHRALSLLLEECLGEIIKRYGDYKPIVLKKFAYSGVYGGEYDYYDSFPLLETKPPKASDKSNYILENPYYEWEKRIAFEVPYECRTRYISNNIIYKAAKKHRSQDISRRVGAICNGDIVYWRRRTDNYLLGAEIEVSSGKGEYLNDFKLFDCDCILIGYIGDKIFNEGCWIPDEVDREKKIKIKMKEYASIQEIVLYQNTMNGSRIKKVRFLIGDMSLNRCVGEYERVIRTVFEPKWVDYIEIEVVESVNNQVQIGEIEILGEDILEIPKDLIYKPRKNILKFDIWRKREKRKIIPWNNNGTNRKEDYDIIVRINDISEWSIAEYLMKKKFCRIYIYGYGKIGYELEKKLGRAVCGVIDQRAGLLSCNKPLYDKVTDEIVDDSDIIIVSSMKSYENIIMNVKSMGISTDKMVSIEMVLSDYARYYSEKDKLR